MISFDDYAAHDGLGLAALVKTGQVSPAELLEAAVARITALNPALNAVIRTRYAAARREAAHVDRQAPFCGVPFLVKDLVATLAGEPTGQGTCEQTKLPGVWCCGGAATTCKRDTTVDQSECGHPGPRGPRPPKGYTCDSDKEPTDPKCVQGDLPIHWCCPS